MQKNIRFKVEKGRVLVPVGEPCPFNCKYCYTRNGEVGPARIQIEEIIQTLRAFVEQNEFETIQLGYDGDPFARPERGIIILQKLAKMDKHVNFSTKALIGDQTLTALQKIQWEMELFNKTLSALVSLSSWESAPFVEPHTPSPHERMITIKNLKSIGVPTFISIRPILPIINDAEYERIVDEGLSAECEGFILGPLYADDKGRFVRFIPSEVLRNVPKTKVTVSWSAHSPIWTRYEDKLRLKKITLMIKEKGGRAFMSSTDAINLVNTERIRV